MGVAWAVVSTGSSFSSLGFSWHRERSDRLGTHRELSQWNKNSWPSRGTSRAPYDQWSSCKTATTNNWALSLPVTTELSIPSETGRLSLEVSPGSCMSAINKCLLLPCLNTDNTLYRTGSEQTILPGSEINRQNINQHKFIAAQGICVLKMVIYEDNPDPPFLQNTKILYKRLEQSHFPNNSSKMNGCLFKPKS